MNRLEEQEASAMESVCLALWKLASPRFAGHTQRLAVGRIPLTQGRSVFRSVPVFCWLKEALSRSDGRYSKSSVGNASLIQPPHTLVNV